MREYLFELLETGGELSLETVLSSCPTAYPTAAAFTAPSSM